MADNRDNSSDSPRKTLTTPSRYVIAYPPSFDQLKESKRYGMNQVRPPEAPRDNFLLSSYVFQTQPELLDGQNSMDLASVPINGTEYPWVNDITYQPSAFGAGALASNVVTNGSASAAQQIYERPERYRYPKMARKEARWQTFYNWPHSLPRAEDLVEANMFYEGIFEEGEEIITDQVVCFKCGQSFREWRADDDPIKEHIRISVKCFYTKWIKEL